MTALLRLDDIHAGYGSFAALFGISLEVEAGEAVAVMGPNGAGKTTLLRVISGMLKPSSGTVALDGRALQNLPAHRILAAGIAHVPENRRLFPRLTVADNLRMGAFLPESRRHFAERLQWVYELFPRLKERASQLAGTMSGGEQQMCAIGRALMSKPRILVVEQVFDLVRRIRAEGFTVLIVEQNVRQVLEVVDRAYLLETGRIKLAGSAVSLKDNDFIRSAYFGI
jgi:branched-chain amino acid transport system ATP-binding protein